MSEVYPCALPLPLVAGFDYQDQELTAFNNLDSGPPIARLKSSEGYTTFGAEFSFNQLQVQVFRSWFRFVIAHGSKAFTIDLNIDGGTTQHTCYMRNPKYSLNGKRWRVSANLVSTEMFGLDDCDGLSVVNIYSGLDEPNKNITEIESVIENVL